MGPTIMETSYLLAGTPVIAYADGKQVEAKPISQPLTIDFGKGLGRKTVWLYNLPEVESAFKYMKVPNVSARFGTDPGGSPQNDDAAQSAMMFSTTWVSKDVQHVGGTKCMHMCLGTHRFACVLARMMQCGMPCALLVGMQTKLKPTASRAEEQT